MKIVVIQEEIIQTDITPKGTYKTLEKTGAAPRY